MERVAEIEVAVAVAVGRGSHELNLEPDSLRGPNGMRRTWEDRFGDCIQEHRAEAGLETVTEQEKGAFETMLRSMLVFRPNERVTAQRVLHSEWVKGWGQLALEESRALSNV
ncbi:hypothetical protein N7513_007237 [Penicillium frequentans]|nr:hypothetical protein N7513_007237 [Penicillium glabrum]